MSVQINGNQLSWGFVAALSTVLVGVGGIQWQVMENTDDLDGHISKPSHTAAQVQLAVLETTQNDIQKELGKLNDHTAAQTILLNEVVRQLAELNAKSDE